MIKHQVTCNDCGLTYFLEDSNWCIHKSTVGIGSKECPGCHSCICHGETEDQIKARFQSNINKGKFVKAKPNIFGWDHMCKTIKEVEVID